MKFVIAPWQFCPGDVIDYHGLHVRLVALDPDHVAENRGGMEWWDVWLIEADIPDWMGFEPDDVYPVIEVAE